MLTKLKKRLKQSIGMTILEITFSLTVMAVLIVVITPGLINLTDVVSINHEKIINIDQTRRALSKMVSDIRYAKKINSSTASTNQDGHIVIKTNDDQIVEYKKDSSMLVFVTGNVSHNLLGPINSITFDGRKKDYTETSSPSQIQTILISLSVPVGSQSITLNAQAHLRKDVSAGLDYMLLANSTINFYDYNNSVIGNVHANHTVSRESRVSISGTVTDRWTQSYSAVSMPTVDFNDALTGYNSYTGYEAGADYIYNGNKTFNANTTYSGIH